MELYDLKIYKKERHSFDTLGTAHFKNLVAKKRNALPTQKDMRREARRAARVEVDDHAPTAH